MEEFTYTITHSVLTMLLEDTGDGFIHILLQFGAGEVEAALKGDKNKQALLEIRRH